MGLFLTSNVAQATTLAEVFTPRTLGMEVSLLDRHIGPPLQAIGRQRHYQVGACFLDVVVRQGKVERLGTEVNSFCDFDLAPFLANRTSVPAFLQTFGKLNAIIEGLHYEAECLAGCDRPDDAQLFAYVHGFQANGGIQVLFLAHAQDLTTHQAAQAWKRAMMDSTSDVYVMEGTFNCDDSQDRSAAPLLSNVVVRRIWVAKDDIDPGQCY